MATKIPSPTLDTRSGDLVVAEAIGNLPAELSDRSDANPAVTVIEAVGSIFDKDLYQANQWPSAVMQKALALVGVNQLSATAATVTQQFTLSAPQPNDTVIASGTLVSTADGTLSFATTAATTVRAYTSPAGTISLTAGSAAVTGSGTTFTTSLAAGWAISTDKNTWYTVASITNDTSLTLTASAASTVSGSSYYAGAITATAPAQATVTGSSTNAAAATLTTLTTSVAGVASTTNPAAATGGTDAETTTNAIARAPLAFASRDTATSVADFQYFAQLILGTNGRAIAQANTNNTTAASGYVSYGLLSPLWTTSSSVSAQERANVTRDLVQRIPSGVTLIDLAANIQQFVTAGSGSSQGTMFACAAYRKQAYDATSTNLAIAAAINTYLSPNTYPWGRTIDPADLAGVLEALTQIDHVVTINGVVAVGMNYTVVANNVSFTNGSTTATGTASDFTGMTANQTFLLDQTNNATYLVTNISSGTLTITPAYAGPTNSQKPAWFTSKQTTLANWYSLPYSSLSVSSANSSIVIVGAV